MARARQYHRLNDVSTLALASFEFSTSTDELRKMIRQVVHEELKKLLPAVDPPVLLPEGSKTTPAAVRVIANHVNLPPRSSVFVPVVTDAAAHGKVLLEGNFQLLLGRGISVARGVTELQDGRTVVLATNFRPETQNLTEGAAVEHVEKLRADAKIAATSDELSPCQPYSTPPPQLDVNPKLSSTERRQLGDLLAEFGDWFATTSRVRQTAVVKHRILTNEDALAVHRPPLGADAVHRPPKEREAIHK